MSRRRPRRVAAKGEAQAVVFAALGDATRLALVAKLSTGAPRSISQLTRGFRLTRQAITKLVDELERLDLVRRDPDPDDGRGVIVKYTDRGRAGVAIARKRMLALERAYAARVGAERWAEVRSTLETLFGDDPHDDPSRPAAPHPSNHERPDHNHTRATPE